MDTAPHTGQTHSQPVKRLPAVIVLESEKPMKRVLKQLQDDMNIAGATMSSVAAFYDLHPNQIKRVLAGETRFSADIIKAVLHEDWSEYRVIARTDDCRIFDLHDDLIAVKPARDIDGGLPARICPITGVTFTPRHHGQRYHHTTTATQRRAYRRRVPLERRPWNIHI